MSLCHTLEVHLVIIGVDAGNDSLKAFDGQTKLTIPNALAKGFDRPVFEQETEQLKALDVEIDSPAVQGRFFIGELALRHKDRVQEMRIGTSKAEDPQAAAVLLTGLAYRAAAAGNFRESVQMATSLPVQAYLDGKATFAARLRGRHLIRFRSTPGLSDREVSLTIEQPIVVPEGAAVAIYLIYGPQARYPELQGKTVLVLDGGAFTSELPVLRGMALDNELSEGRQIGIAPYLDFIASDLESAHGLMNLTRAQVARYVFEQGRRVLIRGHELDIGGIVQRHFLALADRFADLLRQKWDQNPEIAAAIVCGGAPEAVQPDLARLVGPEYRLIFAEDPRWQNAFANYDIARQRFGRHEQRGQVI